MPELAPVTSATSCFSWFGRFDIRSLAFESQRSGAVRVHSSLFFLLNTRESTSRRTRWEKFLFEINAATKRPLQDNKHGTSAEQAGRGAHVVTQIKRPAR
jgi:hypothetical protein